MRAVYEGNATSLKVRACAASTRGRKVGQPRVSLDGLDCPELKAYIADFLDDLVTDCI